MNKIIKPIAVLMSSFLILCMAGCNILDTEHRGAGSKKNDLKFEEYDWEKAKANTVGAREYCRVSACGEYHFDPEGRSFVDGNTFAGEWMKTDEKIFGEEHPNQYVIRYWNIEDSYLPGSMMDVDLTFHVDHDRIGASDDIWGSMYFADIGKGKGSLDEKPAVRKFYKKAQNDDTHDPVEMSHFGKDNDGRRGGAKGSNGDIEYYFEARAAFPRLCGPGDKIYTVLDISGSEGTVIARYLWEYTFRETEPAVETEDTSEYEENYPEFYSVEYPGKWDMTDIRFIGGDGEETGDGDVIIKAERYGVEGEDMVYSFKEKNGSYSRIYIPDFHPETSVYADGSFYAWIKNTEYKGLEDSRELLHCSLALSDVDFDTGKYGVKVNPIQYFKAAPSSEGDSETFDAPGRILLEGSFPEGEKDGEKIYLVYGVMDGFSGGVRMYNIYEYTYTMGPVTEWVNNPPMPD